MSSRTHRWKARSIMKQHTHTTFPEPNIVSSGCSINLHFDKSNYFDGSRDPYAFIFKPVKGYFTNQPKFRNNEPNSPKTDPIHISEVNSSKTKSMPVSNYSDKKYAISQTSGFTPPKRLNANEYVEATSVHKLFCLNNTEVRCFIVSPNNKDVSNIIAELSDFKNELRGRDWRSFRVLVATDGVVSDVDMLRKEQSNKEDSDNKRNVFGGSIHLSKDTENDDDEEKKLCQAVNTSKFRDSRVFSNLKPFEKFNTNESLDAGDVVKAMVKVAKVFDKGIEHTKIIADNVKADVDFIIDSMHEMD